MWSVLLDRFLRLPFEDGISARTYADDDLHLVNATSSPELMRRAVRALEHVTRWGENKNTTFAKENTVIVLLKGKLVKRFIRVNKGDVRIRCSNETRCSYKKWLKCTGQYNQVI